MRKNILIVLAFVGLTSITFAQDKKEEVKPEGYIFTSVKEIPVTSVKNQYRSSTCWSFSVNSFLEAELLRKGKGEHTLSPMFTVYQAFILKAEKYARMHGHTYFPVGGASNDVVDVWRNFGTIPESVYTGINYGEEKHNHKQIDKALDAFLASVINDDIKVLQPSWKTAFTGILNAYLGAPATEFTYNGKKYTPRTFADELGINPDDYIKLGSFTHHPFYSKFALEVPDNWNNGMMYNLPLDEFTKVVDNALSNGYTVAWGGDVSEKGFSWKYGVAIVPDESAQPDLGGTDRDKWESMSNKDRQAQLYKFEKPIKEMAITQELRQKGFDDYTTGDDHGMHLVGTAKDQNGTLYYKVKNSWDTDNIYKGFMYMSVPYFQYKTLDIMVHKDAIPTEIKQKLGIK